MKIGILTFHFSDNYGALLQAYALRTWLMSRGHQVDFVNYHPDYVEAGGDFREILNPARMRTNLKIAYLKFTHSRIKLFGSREVARAMKNFRNDQLGVKGDEFKSVADLKRNPPEYDLLICGSDQIWNPSEQFGVDPVYFLDFPSSCKRRISYAASFGSSEVKDCYREEIHSLLSKLDGVSVREEKSVGFVSELIGTEPVCVPDPTFLLDGYQQLVGGGEEPNSDHIFAYILRSGVGFAEIADALKSRLGVKVLSAYNPHRRWKDVGDKLEGGVVQWLRSLNAAKFVLTNSFHATVFSILLNRPFVAVRLPGARAKLSGRLESLLEKVGLSDRLIAAGDVDSALKLSEKPIDWQEVNLAVASLRNIGRDYLSAQISMIHED